MSAIYLANSHLSLLGWFYSPSWSLIGGETPVVAYFWELRIISRALMIISLFFVYSTGWLSNLSDDQGRRLLHRNIHLLWNPARAFRWRGSRSSDCLQVKGDTCIVCISIWSFTTLSGCDIHQTMEYRRSNIMICFVHCSQVPNTDVCWELHSDHWLWALRDILRWLVHTFNCPLTLTRRLSRILHWHLWWFISWADSRCTYTS